MARVERFTKRGIARIGRDRGVKKEGMKERKCQEKWKS